MIAGRGPAPSLVLLDIQRLPDTSMTSAIQQAKNEGLDDPTPFFGWGTDRWLLKYLRDGVELNTIATGNWKKDKQPKFQEFPSPKTVVDRIRKKLEAKKQGSSQLARVFSMFQNH